MKNIRMLKLCGKSIYKLFDLIFQYSKKANVPVHKKEDKQILKIYWPPSLLPICWKNCERLIYNNLFEYVIENDLISQIKSGFKPGDSFINQLLSITYQVYQSFDGGLEVTGVVLDVPKAFDKVWYDGLIINWTRME